ncbi:DMT family transporter [Aminipila butyrica]|uniref:DMT family transporter n=1 Tax=Aminipila butyrica TaxID=433296 RepID=A0A858BSF4_9FIRM|nr:DMT family transporter [Aminipila butyrica]QIB68901.1 DMT family transporter [Aminipila butyrica]
MSKKTEGILYAVLSAIIYGFTPILARIAYDGGANGITVAFLRGAIPLPLLFVVLRSKKISLRLGSGLKPFLWVSMLGLSLTTILLYMSYSYISVGMATTLHFVYPVLVSLACAIFFKEKINLCKIIALILCSGGIGLFMDQLTSSGGLGIVLAILSGGTYTLYLICIDKSGLKDIHYLQLTFYLNVGLSVIAGVFGAATGKLNLLLSPMAWALCTLVALFTTLGALPLLQQGIKLTGASTAAILSTLEPITSVILGILILSEKVSTIKLVGCVFIIVSILLITLSESDTVFFKNTAGKIKSDESQEEMDCLSGTIENHNK